ALAPGQSRSFTVSFHPQSAGPRFGYMTLGGNTLDGWTVIDLSGNGTPAPGQPAPPPTRQPQLSVSPTSMDFGTAPVNDPAAVAQTLTLSNPGSAPLDVTVQVLDATGDYSPDFQIDAPDRATWHLLPGASRSTHVTFTP